MATINLGAIKFNWKGAYNSSTSYAVDDVVSSGGNSYVCIQAHSNQAVGNATAYWNIMSSAGTNGTNGTDLTSTLTTQGDLVYRDGSGLQRLGAGTSGQVLQTGGSGANPSWGTVSSDFVKLQSYTNLSGANGNYIGFDFSSLFSSTYQHYKLILNGCYNTSSGGYQLRARFNVGGALKQDGYYQQITHYNDAQSSSQSDETVKRWDTDYLTITWLEDTTPDHDCNVEFTFYKPTLTNTSHKVHWMASGQDNNYMYLMNGYARYRATLADIQGISFWGDSNTSIYFRYATLYGIK
jgi:hypothetical protein